MTKRTMFSTPFYYYGILNWNDKKTKISNVIDDSLFVRAESFSSDRKLSTNSYLESFVEVFKDDLEIFQTELEVNEMFITDVWSVKYEQGDFHPVHNHSSTGYSGIIYLNFNDDEHTGTYFVNNQTNPITDATDSVLSYAHEGAMIVVPSSVLHFTYPNKSSSIRQIIGFDVKFRESKVF